ncbi:MAG: ABC transporter substrate-binding protein [Clostridiales bacterium]|nr:ABC transporter substrate-binding protein [Clostridiales bacterium]
MKNNAGFGDKYRRKSGWTRVIAVIAAAVLLLSACSAGGTPAAPLSGKTVVDYLGREVAVPEQVESVAVFYNYIGQVVALLDGGDMIRAVVEGMKRDELLRRKIPGIADLPVPSGQSSINIETMMSIKPDITLMRYETAMNAGDIENMEKAGFLYAVVDFFDIETQRESIRLVGEIIGRTAQAEQYLAYYDQTLALIRSRTADIPEGERIRVYHSVNEVVRTNHPNEISYYVLEAVGCINVAEGFSTAELGGKVNVSVEQIYLWDPDVVIANEPAAVEYMRTNEAFTGLRAVREDRVYQLPVGASRWGHPGSLETPIAALYIAKLLYPTHFEDIDIREEIRDFYHDFWMLDLDEEEIESIISGVGMREPKDGRQ